MAPIGPAMIAASEASETVAGPTAVATRTRRQSSVDVSAPRINRRQSGASCECTDASREQAEVWQRLTRPAGADFVPVITTPSLSASRRLCAASRDPAEPRRAGYLRRAPLDCATQSCPSPMGNRRDSGTFAVVIPSPSAPGRKPQNQFVRAMPTRRLRD